MSEAGTTFDHLDGSGLSIGVATARFNEAIGGALRKWCLEGLTRHGVAADRIVEVSVPGAFELPLAAQTLIEQRGVDAVVCLGAVVRGETPHFDYVAGEAARGVQRVALETGVPVLFGVLTTDTVEQALARARDDETNKGYEAACGAIDMVRTLDRLRAAGKDAR